MPAVEGQHPGTRPTGRASGQVTSTTRWGVPMPIAVIMATRPRPVRPPPASTKQRARLPRRPLPVLPPLAKSGATTGWSNAAAGAGEERGVTFASPTMIVAAPAMITPVLPRPATRGLPLLLHAIAKITRSATHATNPQVRMASAITQPFEPR